METIFLKTGYYITSKANSNAQQIKCLQITNKDGSIRWLWNSKNKKPLFLDLYNNTSIKSKAYIFTVKIIFFLKLQLFFYKYITFYIEAKDVVLFDFSTNWVVYNGHQKNPDFSHLYDGQNSIKIANSEIASNQLINEFHIIQKLNKENLSFQYPQIENFSNDCLLLSNNLKMKTNSKVYQEQQFDAILALNAINKRKTKVVKWDYFSQLKAKFYESNDARIPANLVHKIGLLLNSISKDEVVDLSFSHGNFTHWNMYRKNGMLGICNWELASFDKPKGFDYFHFIFQKNMKNSENSWNKLYQELKKNTKGSFYKILFNENEKELNKYLKWYMLINCLNYLEIYETQKVWNQQMNWLLAIWNDSFNHLLKDFKTDKELLIIDLFEVLENKEQVHLKYYNGLPVAVNIMSNEKQNELIYKFLKNHNCVAKVKKSLKNPIQIITNDTQKLALDIVCV